MRTEEQRAYHRAYYHAHKPRLVKRLTAVERKELSDKVQKKFLESSILPRLKHNIRSRLYKETKKQGVNIPTSLMFTLLGCTLEEFKIHIENQFKRGIKWENYGAWNLDHIKSLNKFDLTDPEQLSEACHFTNYQPLWGPENFSKK